MIYIIVNIYEYALGSILYTFPYLSKKCTFWNHDELFSLVINNKAISKYYYHKQIKIVPKDNDIYWPSL